MDMDVMMNWYVLYTKPKSEKKVAERLTEMGINAYCPIITKITQWSDRKKKVQLPLFNSYIFVRLTEKERNSVFDVPGVVRYLFWLGKPAIVKDKEIETIQNWLSAPDTFDVVIDTWRKGDKVVLESGPFIDQEATVQEVKQNHYLLVLESLGCVLKVEKK
ncbi:Transcription antitermination protein RfaH [Flavobacterium sp. CECT 9288]|nr:Transcription antitermination protein RfaH [Flavobacterium sp. CECT 9288]